MSSEFASLFLAALSEDARAALASQAELSRKLDGILATCATAWPGCGLEPAVFLRYLAERVPATDASLALDKLHATDLFLACACSLGDGMALALFEREFLAKIGPAVAKIGGDDELIADVQQQIRHRLLVGDDAGPGKIIEFSGRGELGAWLRVIAVRTALNSRRRPKGEVTLDDAMLAAVPSSEEDPGLLQLKGSYRAEFAEAFARAMKSLQPRERTLLRQYYLDGLTYQELGAMHRVHHGTIGRSLERIRAQLLSSTQKQLMGKLGVDRSEVESIMRLIQSNLDVSLAGLLRTQTSRVAEPDSKG